MKELKRILDSNTENISKCAKIIEENQKIVDEHQNFINKHQKIIDENQKFIDKFNSEEDIIKNIEKKRILFVLKDKLTKEYAIDYYLNNYLNNKIFYEELIDCHCQSLYLYFCTCTDKGWHARELSKEEKIKYIKCCKKYDVLFDDFSENKAYFRYSFYYHNDNSIIKFIFPIVLDY